MYRKILITNLILIVQLSSGANLDSPFALDPDELQLKEISDNVLRVSGAVMGISEYILEIRQELKTIRADIEDSRSLNVSSSTNRPNKYYSRPVRDPEEVRRQSLELADKVEKLLAMDQSPEVDLAKEELRKTVEKNFLRMLAAILVTGPAQTKDRSDDILKLMRAVLNGEIDFTPVVQKLPLILRDSETNQFVNLLITLRESERGGSKGASGGSFRQGLISTVETTNHNPNYRPIYNFPNNQQYYNPVQNLPQYIPGHGQYINNGVPINNNGIPINNNGVPINNNNINHNVHNLGSLNNGNINQYNPNINHNNLQAAGGGAGVGATHNNQQNLNNVNTNTQTPTATPSPNQLPSINSIIEGINQTNQLIKEIPSLVEGLQTLVESLEGIFG